MPKKVLQRHVKGHANGNECVMLYIWGNTSRNSSRSLKGESDRCAIALSPKRWGWLMYNNHRYLQVTSHNRYVLIAERGSAVNLYSWKGFVTKELSISSFKYVVSDLYPVDIYRQNFEMIFRKLISFLSPRRRDLKLYWYREDKSICYDSWERKSRAFIGKIYRLQLCFHLRFDSPKLRIFCISQQFVPP